MRFLYILPTLAIAGMPGVLPAQPSYLDLTINDVGIAIGDAPRVTGLRINFRDRHLERVNGVNITVWTPYEATGDVNGIAIGIPATGARRVDGLASGLQVSARRIGYATSQSRRSERAPERSLPVFSSPALVGALVAASRASRSQALAWARDARFAAR